MKTIAEMANHCIAIMNAKKKWLTIFLFAAAAIILTTTLFHGGVGSLNPTKLFFFTGLIILFFALLNTRGYRSWRYYTLLLAVLVILTFLPFFLPEEWDLVKIQARNQIPGHWAEDMAWSFGFILFTGYLAGIIGLIIAIRRRK